MVSVEESICIVRIRGANAAVSLGYEILEAYLISSKHIWLRADVFSMNHFMTPRAVQRVGECRNMLCDMWIKRDTEEEKNVR